jgi:hypothetical protein
MPEEDDWSQTRRVISYEIMNEVNKLKSDGWLGFSISRRKNLTKPLDSLVWGDEPVGDVALQGEGLKV